jgi:pyruvate formate lyase activating enzyme
LSELNCEIFEIIRGTTHDGPGMRTTVFFKGCPLHCAWCQNPEGIKSGPGIWWDQRKCINCLTCLETCTHGAVFEDESGLHRDLSKCQLCGDCVEECPAQAMTFTNQEWTFDQLCTEVLKDKEYYRAFGGGVTVSGGEPLRQFPFVANFFKRLKEEGIHTALDTCGLASRAAFEAVLPYTDMVLFDIKLIDTELHQRFTGQPNEIILKNLLYIADTMRDVNQARTGSQAAPMRLWIRTPLIPDATATDENLAAIGGFIRDNLPDLVERWELCTFNPACVSKYQKMDLTWVYADYPLMGESDVNRMKAAALSSGIASEKLVVSGLVAQQLKG